MNYEGDTMTKVKVPIETDSESRQSWETRKQRAEQSTRDFNRKLGEAIQFLASLPAEEYDRLMRWEYVKYEGGTHE